MPKENKFNKPSEEIFPRPEKKVVFLMKLRKELKVFSDSVLVIDMAKYNEENNPHGERADIAVLVKKNLKDVKDYLEGEAGFKIIREGPSPIFSKDDTAFWLKITD
ncbi:MAG: hypothetical protein HYT98_02300 [Candidatus Sungbacteria bacterium]|nr:hypothetical protein [Candidatus Sungbacteria bacterium]